ncbi:low affinity immunoglobulin epsilon Fc receptor-like protein [Leptotrombidium deliense]|uniref:Low affinity immunoglobulin epsilon Fc receptor-like protein n=1 Tax=Leptotrombidium deliense TaxID=299467 RepID=A0A443RYZ5_9ACAR|nr:low affinity immunoglobulin epsilon Fc receptor-like protein [Leptotrombidium deliense]
MVDELNTTLCFNECPNRWSLFNGICYWFVEKSGSFQDSRNFCHSIKAEIVSVHSVEQMNFIQVLAKDQNHTGVWLSASRVEAENLKFVWHDGSELEYSYWGSRWPSNDPERK